MIDWLSDTLFATTLLIALVLVLRAPVARLFGARIAYALWLLPAARLFMPAIEKTVIVPATPASGDLGTELMSGSAVVAAPVDASFDWTALLLTIWLGGALALFLWRIATYVQEREDILAEAKDIETIDGVRLVEAPLASGPMAIGLVEKVIALPSNFTRDYSDEERELALGHEMAHHKSGDLIINFAAFVMLCLHWFNPLAWIAWRAFRFDQELACDERVLAASGTHQRGIYGRAVAKAASGHAPIFASALNNRESLKKRLKMMKRAKVSGRRRIAGMTAIAMGVAVALPLTATVTYAYVQQEPPAPPAAPEAPQPPAPGDHDIDLEFVEDGDDGERRVIVMRSNSAQDEDGERRVRRHVIHRRGDHDEHDIPTREELRAMIPEIDIEEACDGRATPVHSVRRQGDNGREQIAITICREGLAEEARQSALEGLREAREELADVRELSDTLRAEILADLDREIAELQRELN